MWATAPFWAAILLVKPGERNQHSPKPGTTVKIPRERARVQKERVIFSSRCLFIGSQQQKTSPPWDTYKGLGSAQKGWCCRWLLAVLQITKTMQNVTIEEKRLTLAQYQGMVSRTKAPLALRADCRVLDRVLLGSSRGWAVTGQGGPPSHVYAKNLEDFLLVGEQGVWATTSCSVALSVGEELSS